MLILDFLLLMMLAVCIGYSYVLNRRINDLNNSRVEFARMIKELNASIGKAETSVNELGELSRTTTTELKKSIDEAKNTASDLLMMNEIGNNIADNLSEQILTIKREQKSEISQEELLENIIKESEKLDHTENKVSYTNQIRNFINTIVTQKDDDQGVHLNQMGFYDTLRKVSMKK